MKQFTATVYSVTLLIGLTLSFGNLASAEEKTISFGATLALTGNTAPFAQACRRGIDLAVEDVNAAGGIQGAKLKMIIEDFREEDIKLAVSGAQKLVNIDKVAALFSNWSEDAEVTAPVADARKIISMSLGAGGPGAARFANSAFRATTSDAELAKISAHVERQNGSKRACVLLANTGYYVDISKELSEEWKRAGGSVAYEEALPYGSTDVRTSVTKVKSADCQSVLIWTPPNTAAAIIAELRKQRVKARRVLPWFADMPEVLEPTRGDSSPHFLYRWSFTNTDFMTRYQQRFVDPFMRPAGNCYDGVRVVAKVMNDVGTDQAKVKEALLNLKDYVGVTGPFLIAADRERSGEVPAAFKVVDGKLVPFQLQ